MEVSLLRPLRKCRRGSHLALQSRCNSKAAGADILFRRWQENAIVVFGLGCRGSAVLDIADEIDPARLELGCQRLGTRPEGREMERDRIFGP
jgi:hypothetical protein